MSFNNLAFNISKATPTTSTTNTNTISTSSSPPKPASILATALPASVNKDSKIPLLQNMLSRPSDPSPKIAAVATTSELSPTTVSITDSATANNTDLIGLFDKFDIDDKAKDLDSEPEINDPIEEKMKQFQTAKVEDTSTDTIHYEQTLEKALGDLTEEDTHPHESKSTAEILQVELQDKSEPLIEDSLAEKKEVVVEERKVDPPAPAVHESMTIQPYIIPSDEPAESSPVEDDQPNTYEDQSEDLLSMEQTETVEEFDFGDSEVAPEVPTSSLPQRPRLRRNNSIQRTREHINPREQYQQSHKPFDFQIFLTHLKKKSADPIVRYIRSFLISFTKQSNTLTASQMIKAIRQFKDFIKEKFELYEPFASMDLVDLENSNEGIEKLIMNRLYAFCFAPEAIKKFGSGSSPSILQDVKEDRAFALQLEKFSWILGAHLDIDLDDIAKRKHETSKDSMDYLDYTIRELNKMNNYRAPRDKIICVLNACKIIFSLLRVSKQETNADAFIPLLILVIVRAKTENIISNLHYIERFRGEEWLNHGETSYYLSSVQGALSFIQNVKFEDLTVTQEEYDANIEAWEADMRQRRPQLSEPEPLTPSAIDIPLQGPRQSLSPSNVLLASAEMFTKSISNFISPSPQERSPPPASERHHEPEEPTEAQVDEVFNNLSEIFTALDKAILRDIIIMNKADMDASLEVCLQLNES